MKRLLQVSLAVGFLLAISPPVWAQKASSGSVDLAPTIIVRVYNYAQVQRPTLDRAERLATKIFRRAGVRTVWLDCQRTPLACDQPLGLSDLVLRVIDRPRDAGTVASPQACGFALAVTEGGGGTFATLFYAGTKQIAKDLCLRQSFILGHKAAHEIGHLLLPPGHSRTGIMRATLVLEDWRRAAKGFLLFTPEETKQLRTQVLRRSG